MRRRSGRVVVVGSANMDLVAYGPRLPVPGETVLAERFRRSPGGKGANQAIAAARSGALTTFIGTMGQDAFGDEILQSLNAAGVVTQRVRRTSADQTGVALVTVDDEGRNLITVVPGANRLVDWCIGEEFTRLLADASIVLLQLEIPIEAVVFVARLAHDAGATVILNPAPTQHLPAQLLECVDILVPNQTELLNLAGRASEGETEGELARKLLSSTGRAIVVTLGADGALVVTSESEKWFGAHRVKVVDTTGAGDTFVGALASRLAAADSLYDAVTYANAAAALKVRTKGAQESIPEAHEVRKFLDKAPA